MLTARNKRKPLYKVRKSRIHGTGVFAARRIRKGTRIVEYVGDRVSHADADRRYEDRPEDDNHTFLFIVDNRTVIDAGVDGNEARFINHRCDPNCETVIEDRRVFIEAVRAIEPGEELAYDYQIKRDKDDPKNIDEIFACRCGAAECRGSMLEPKKVKKAGKKSMLALVVAVAENGIIGSANRLPWHLPADLRHFKALTLGKPVLMGRKTFESIGRPLPQRRNLVLTQRKGFTGTGVEAVGSLEEAIALAGDVPELMVIGGTQVYRLALPKAERIYLTRVHAAVPGDARFPHCDWNQWREISRVKHAADEKNIHAMSFITLERAPLL